MREGPVRKALIILVGLLVLLALFFQIAIALKRGQAFYGTNYQGLPLGVAYPTLGLVILGGVGLVRGVTYLYSIIKRHLAK